MFSCSSAVSGLGLGFGAGLGLRCLKGRFSVSGAGVALFFRVSVLQGLRLTIGLRVSGEPGAPAAYYVEGLALGRHIVQAVTVATNS